MRMPSFPPADRRRAVARGLWTLTFLALAGAAGAQDRPATSSRPLSDIRDEAGMFSASAIDRAKMQLQRIERLHRVPTIIETIDALQGQMIDDAALRRVRKLGGEGIYILSARRDRRIAVLVSDAFTNLVPEEKRLAIRGAFIDGFKQGNYDRGLEEGTAMIEKVLAGGRLAEKPGELETPRLAPAEEDASALVLRDQVRLTLAGARRILAGAEARAAAMGLRVNIAVVDDGGHMIAFERMEGARPASGYTATTKAITAATLRAPSGPLPPGTDSPDPLLNLSLQNAALASGGKITTLYGGVPVLVDDQVIGGVGVGGGTGEQDATVARAGIDAFLSALNQGRPEPPARRDEK